MRLENDRAVSSGPSASGRRQAPDASQIKGLAPAARRGNRWATIAVLVWAGILLACCGRDLLASRTKSVYPIFAAAARRWPAGADLYDLLAPGLDRFRYSPAVAALLVPFSLLPDGLGAIVWRFVNAGVYLGALAWWIRVVLPAALTTTQRAALFLLVVPLSIGSLNNGQSNALVLGLLLAAGAGARTDRWNVAAGCTTAACLFKVYPIAVGLLLAAVYPRRFAARLALALALGLALPFGLQHGRYVAEQYASWLHHFQAYDRQCLIAELWYRDIRLMYRPWLGALDLATYTTMQILVAAAMAAFCLAGRCAGWPRERVLVVLFALGSCWMTVLGPATESCTYILLAPTLAWALLQTWQTRRVGPVPGLIVTSYGLFVGCQMAVWFPFGRDIHTLGLQPLAGLLLLAGILFPMIGDIFQHQSLARANGLPRPA
jgi:hypothetical protein